MEQEEWPGEGGGARGVAGEGGGANMQCVGSTIGLTEHVARPGFRVWHV